MRSAAQLISGVPTPQFLAMAAPNIQDFFNTYGGGKTFNFTQTYTAARFMDAAVPAGLDPATPTFGTVAFKAPQNAGGGAPQNTYNFVVRGDYNLSPNDEHVLPLCGLQGGRPAGRVFASPYSQYNVGADDQ